MLRLVGWPSVSTLPLILFERSYPVSTAFIRMLRHVRFVRLRAVITPSVVASSVVRSASLQLCLALLGCSLAFPACLLDNSTVILFIDGCEEFEIFTYTVFLKLYYFSVFVPIPCISTVFLYSYIGTIFLYSYRSPISVLFSYICTDLLYRYHFPILWHTIVDIFHANHLTCNHMQCW